MKALIVNRKYLVIILVTVLIVLGTQGSYGQTITASTPEPLTEANLHGRVVTLTLSGKTYDQFIAHNDAVTVSGIDGVTFRDFFDVDRVSDTEVTVELTFDGDFDTDATLTFTVAAGAIVGYNGPALTAEVPVTAMRESLTASTEAPLTEATLHGSVVTLTLSGRRFTEYRWEIEDALTISGIDGVGVRQFDVKRVSDTVVTVELVFSGDFNSDATLTFTIGAGAMVGGYNGPALTAKIPVIAVEQSDATVSVSPSPILLPAIGEQLALSLNIANGKNVVGYQATVLFDGSTLDYVKSANGDYLPADALVGGTIIVDGWLGETFSEENAWKVILLATTFAGAANGDGTLATLTFEVLDYKASKVTLSQVYLVDSDGKRWEATTESGEVTELPEPAEKIFGDINRDSIVNIQDLMIISVRFGQRGQNSADLNGDGLVDIVDLVLAANAFGAEAAGPSLNPQILEQLTAADVKSWLTQARQLILTDPAYLRGITVLEQLLMALTPKTTALLPNFPNPFNPETWIPYQLAKPTEVTITIYAANGQGVRTLALGHQPAGIYQTRSRAAYWNGRNAFGEPVASGVYFYTLTARDFTATRKMLIRK